MIKYLVLSIVLLVSCSTHNSMSNLDAAQFNKIKNKYDNKILVDVRTEEEFNQGAIKDAILLDIYKEEEFKNYFKSVNRDTPVLLYCRSGKRSETAKSVLEEMGFTAVSDLDGGYISWKEYQNKKGSD